MTESDIVAACDLLHRRMGDRREECHDEAQEDRTDGDERCALKSTDRENDADHARHIEGVMPCEEDELQRRKTCNEDVCHHTECHDECCLCTKILQRHTNDGLVVRHNAVDPEPVLEHYAEVRECAHRESRAAAKDQDAHNRLD